MTRKRVAVLISGRGSNMRSLVEAADSDNYPAEIVAVVSNRPDAPGLKWASDRGLPTSVVDHKNFSGRADFEQALTAELAAVNADLICCAGFMRLMTAEFVTSWEGRMLNIHPSLLPLFKGLHPHEQALAAGVRISGCTVHFVVPEMDSGPIVAQAAVKVAPDDTAETLAARILEAEHRLYPLALRLVASGEARLEQGRVITNHRFPGGGVLFSPGA